MQTDEGPNHLQISTSSDALKDTLLVDVSRDQVRTKLRQVLERIDRNDNRANKCLQINQYGSDIIE